MDKPSIKQWAEDDRPREKLLKKGRSSLSDAELLAILIGSGNRNESAVDLSQRILREYENDLIELGKVGIAELTSRFRGIGEAKAITITAAIELGRRRREVEGKKRKKITSSKDAFEIFQPKLGDLPIEEFWILHLNRANKIIGEDLISRGGVAGTVADTKVIFKKALEKLSSSVILCHNHPSGNLSPSAQDINLTERLKEAGKLLDISVLDHLIVTDSGYFSFADEGKM
ncbi:MAG: DNA repair protein RadC [Flavobacteriales bacterium]|nr:DNA repair protein RadC [Flavobacteriales bacterium]